MPRVERLPSGNYRIRYTGPDGRRTREEQGTMSIVYDAELSACGQYRYSLLRRWGDGPALVWVMLNPSTADADVDDPTIRRVVAFTRAGGYPAALVLNLYALRATDPAELDRHPDPVGPANGQRLDLYARGLTVVCAWGARRAARGRAFDVVHKHLDESKLVCLGMTKDGSPRHPLYVSAATPFETYRYAAG